MTILEGNKLIAEFMGWHDEIIQSFTPPNDRKYFCSPNGTERVVFSYPLHEGDLKYHTSWDWLMPVWFKFRGLKVSDETHEKHLGFKYYIANAICYGENGDYIAAHKKIVEAIQWYNENNK